MTVIVPPKVFFIASTRLYLFKKERHIRSPMLTIELEATDTLWYDNLLISLQRDQASSQLKAIIVGKANLLVKIASEVTDLNLIFFIGEKLLYLEACVDYN